MAQSGAPPPPRPSGIMPPQMNQNLLANDFSRLNTQQHQAQLVLILIDRTFHDSSFTLSFRLKPIVLSICCNIEIFGPLKNLTNLQILHGKLCHQMEVK